PPANQVAFMEQFRQDLIRGEVLNLILALVVRAGTRGRGAVAHAETPSEVDGATHSASHAEGPSSAPDASAHRNAEPAARAAEAESSSHGAPSTRPVENAEAEASTARSSSAAAAEAAVTAAAPRIEPMTLERLRERGGRYSTVIAVGEPNSMGLTPVMKPNPAHPGAVTVEWIEPRVIPRNGRVVWDEVTGTSVHLRVDGDTVEIIMMNSTGRLPTSRSVPEAARLAGVPQPRFVTSTRIVAQNARTNPQYQQRLQAATLGERLSAEQVREVMGRGPFVFIAGFGGRIVAGTVIEAPGGRTMRFEVEY
ncbi:MAG: hypothetical protein KC561_08180, partial [Myxococcales bacterium]|nr:hypothetical protein [Myxococcales bacterium]